jgi:hypothetical protein
MPLCRCLCGLAAQEWAAATEAGGGQGQMEAPGQRRVAKIEGLAADQLLTNGATIAP